MGVMLEFQSGASVFHLRWRTAFFPWFRAFQARRRSFVSLFVLPVHRRAAHAAGRLHDLLRLNRCMPGGFYFCNKTIFKMHISIKRIYDPQDTGDGYRVLVDRLWPRGISKEKASWDEWEKNVAPTTRLRRWFDHDDAKWDTFRQKYFEELDNNKEGVPHLLQLARKGKITLLYSARNTEHNEAAALRDYLMQQSSS